jgi:hypothetical protein
MSRSTLTDLIHLSASLPGRSRGACCNALRLPRGEGGDETPLRVLDVNKTRLDFPHPEPEGRVAHSAWGGRVRRPKRDRAHDGRARGGRGHRRQRGDAVCRTHPRRVLGACAPPSLDSEMSQTKQEVQRHEALHPLLVQTSKL